MIQFLKDLEVLELVGINKSSKNKTKYISTMMSLVLESALTRVFDSNMLSEENLDRLLSLTESSGDSNVLQKEIVSLFPELLNVIEEESYKLKKELLLGLLNEIQFEPLNSLDSSLVSLIKDLQVKLLNEDESHFEDLWKSFSGNRLKFFIIGNN